MKFGQPLYNISTSNRTTGGTASIRSGTGNRNTGTATTTGQGDIGPVISEKGLARIAGYAGKSASLSSWQHAASHVRDINACAFPDYPETEWDKWARRTHAVPWPWSPPYPIK